MYNRLRGERPREEPVSAHRSCAIRPTMSSPQPAACCRVRMSRPIDQESVTSSLVECPGRACLRFADPKAQAFDQLAVARARGEGFDVGPAAARGRLARWSLTVGAGVDGTADGSLAHRATTVGADSDRMRAGSERHGAAVAVGGLLAVERGISASSSRKRRRTARRWRVAASSGRFRSSRMRVAGVAPAVGETDAQPVVEGFAGSVLLCLTPSRSRYRSRWCP
jgi:hypothetical protein